MENPRGRKFRKHKIAKLDCKSNGSRNNSKNFEVSIANKAFLFTNGDNMKLLILTYVLLTTQLNLAGAFRSETTSAHLGEVFFDSLLNGDYGGLLFDECNVAAVDHHSYTHLQLINTSIR